MRENIGFISKKKVAIEIAKIYNTKGNDAFDIGGCSALDLLCYRLNITPMHSNKLGHITGEMIKKYM